ncbi:unnamed protein product [Ostreobium quekettii]|uniref:Uncharacterized protein n=1 Tax=Ostreobium quekettii TaxID=121088 RepID=A0A8S1J0A4_9CHLO|nr:unnamed protein product [Ostreobium quekettii]
MQVYCSLVHAAKELLWQCWRRKAISHKNQAPSVHEGSCHLPPIYIGAVVVLLCSCFGITHNARPSWLVLTLYCYFELEGVLLALVSTREFLGQLTICYASCTSMCWH